MNKSASMELINKFETMNMKKEDDIVRVKSNESFEYINNSNSSSDDEKSIHNGKTFIFGKKNLKKENTERILQIGCGVVGSANIKGYKYHGFDVVGLDVIPSIIENMNKDEIETRHPDDDLTDWNDISIILISVPTPLNKETKKLSMKYIWSTIPTVIQMIQQSSKEIIVVMRSTVPPGLSVKYERKLEYELHKINCEKRFYIAFQPEFLRCVTAEEDAKHPWKVLFGYKHKDTEVKKRMSNMLLRFVNGNKDDLKIMTLEEAELHKYIHNYYNALKISFSNSIYGLIRAINEEEMINMDTQRIMDIVASTSEGFLNPKYGIKVGAPYGGTCLSKDPQSLITLAKEYNTDERIFKFLNGVEEVNEWITERKDLHVEMKFSPNLMSHKQMKQ